MILVDSSVWIDLLNDRVTPQTDFLDQILPARTILIGDLILAEVLQGARSEAHAALIASELSAHTQVDIGGRSCAVAAAENYRKLRALGMTPRKTIDTLIATRCILDGLELLHTDRDFEPFERHLGLKTPQLV